MLDSPLMRLNSVKKEIAAVAFGLTQARRPPRRPLSGDALTDLLAGAMSLVGAQRGLIALPVADTDDFNVVAAVGMERDTAWTTGEISQSIVRTVMDEGRGVLTHNAAEDGRFCDRTSVVVSGLRSVLCVPLYRDGGLWGALYVDNPVKSGAFKETQLRLLKDFAVLSTMDPE